MPGKNVATKIQENMNAILEMLAAKPRDEGGYAWVSGKDVQEATKLIPAEINDAVNLLEEQRMVETYRSLGTAPFDFYMVSIAPRGRYEHERSLSNTETTAVTELPFRPPSPIGSPFGFTDIDWELVANARSKSDILMVVFGHAFESKTYDTKKLRENVQSAIENAVEAYKKRSNPIQVTLQFQLLSAGYGEHLFNEIARDIISADIAIFDTSDLNPNVMLEMGVALTWGTRVLPIKDERCPKPPSDISGQTWVDYRDSASEFTDPEHENKLIAMIDRAARKKLSRT